MKASGSESGRVWGQEDVCPRAAYKQPIRKVSSTDSTLHSAEFGTVSVFSQVLKVGMYENKLILQRTTRGCRKLHYWGFCNPISLVVTLHIARILRSAHTVYLCVLCGSQNKQRLFSYTALTGWFYNRDGVCLLRGTNFIYHQV
jgi:hypothetical protein